MLSSSSRPEDVHVTLDFVIGIPDGIHHIREVDKRAADLALETALAVFAKILLLMRKRTYKSLAVKEPEQTDLKLLLPCGLDVDGAHHLVCEGDAHLRDRDIFEEAGVIAIVEETS